MKLPFMKLFTKKHKTGVKPTGDMRLAFGFSPHRRTTVEIALDTRLDRKESREDIERMIEIDGCLHGKD